MRKWGSGEDRSMAEIFKHSFCSIFFAPDHIINPPAGLFFNIIDCLRHMHPPSCPLPPYHQWSASCGLAPPERGPCLSHRACVAFWEQQSQGETPEGWSWHRQVAFVPVLCNVCHSSGIQLDLKGSAGLLGRFPYFLCQQGDGAGLRRYMS